MTITELITLLEDHLYEYGDLEILSSITTIVTDKGLEIQSESEIYKKQMSENMNSFLLGHKNEILELYDNN